MALTVVTLETQDRIGTLTLNRPEKLNALNPSLIAEFAEAIDTVAADPGIKVLIIRGAGRAFSTGYDLSGGGRSAPRTIDEDRAMLQRNVEHWLRLRDLPKPVIAMVHGYCLAYVSAFWNWMVGPHRTKYLAFLPGSQISGREAEAMGFATRVFPADKLEEETYSYARRVAKVPAQKLQLEKLAVNRAMDFRGFRASVLSGAEYDALFHFGPGNEEIKKVREERGLRGAIQWYEEQ